jgi:hypothetical protein
MLNIYRADLYLDERRHIKREGEAGLTAHTNLVCWRQGFQLAKSKPNSKANQAEGSGTALHNLRIRF